MGIEGRRFLLGCVLAVVIFQVQPAAAQQSTAAPHRGSAVSQVNAIAFKAFSKSARDDAYRQAWIGAIQLVALDERKRARPLLEDLVSSQRFDELLPTERHAGLLLAGMVSMAESDYEYAHQMLVRSSSMPQAIIGDWSGRFVAASHLGDRVDALNSVSGLLYWWPDEWRVIHLDTLAFDIVMNPVGEQREAQFKAMNALFDAGFKEFDTTPSVWWEWLVTELMERGDVERASRTVAAIVMPQALINFQIDRRFDALVRKQPQAFDVKAASRKQVAECEASVPKFPDSLGAITKLAAAYSMAGQFADVLRVTDGIQAPAVKSGKAAVTIALLSRLRALALESLQRVDDAEKQYRASAHDGLTISATLDLAEFYANRNRGKEALDALGSVPDEEHGLSPYGAAQVRLIRLTAALELHDQDEVRRCFDYLRAHQSDAPELFQIALVRVDATAEATQLIIARLKDAKLRKAALKQVQTYLVPVDSPVVHETHIRWARILERPEVKAAIAAVGRRKSFEVVEW